MKIKMVTLHWLSRYVALSFCCFRRRHPLKMYSIQTSISRAIMAAAAVATGVNSTIAAAQQPRGLVPKC
jgi:hypothetical protein